MGLRKRKHNSTNNQKVEQKDTEKIEAISKREWIEKSIGFELNALLSLEKFTNLLYKKCDASSLALTRIMFGIVMLIDTLEERGFSNAEKIWGDPNECRFPLFNFLQPLPVKVMCFLYLIMCIGAIGISLGFYFRQSCVALTLCYWYIFLLNKTVWNNHSYLFGLLLILMSFSSANNYWSLDKSYRKIKTGDTVPLWNYTILRFQMFALYFFAGLKKIDSDWLRGYSMTSLGKHWVFNPFKLILSGDQVDLWIVHISGFILDFSAGFLIFFDSTRYIAFIFLTMFHFMNSRLFHIGMFPYMCLITMPIFCSMNWPKQFKNCLMRPFSCTRNNTAIDDMDKTKKISPDIQENISESNTINISSICWRKKLTSICLVFYIIIQCLLPYSHFVTKGYNNWTNGLYGYSWDMMVHTWDRNRVIVKLVDKTSQEEYFLNHEVYAPSERWATHADMVIQFAQCVKNNIKLYKPSLNNVSIYIDVWCSLNGRFQQRMFDPNVDLLTTHWSPFEPVKWLMPLLNDLSNWREKITFLQDEVWSWSNYSDVLFYADFPGLSFENYIKSDLTNVSLTILEGSVIMEIDGKLNKTLISGESEPVQSKSFHKIHTISSTPSCFMYSFTNKTLTVTDKIDDKKFDDTQKSLIEILYNDLKNRLKNIKRVITLIYNTF